MGVLPLGSRTIAVVAEDGSCPPGEPGLRVLTLETREPPVDATPLRYVGTESPGRLVASGGYAYVAWHGAGLRVVDFAEVRAKTVAQFVPANGDVVGVGLLAEHVVVSDAYQGLFILERPNEGGGRATFWSQFLSIFPYLGFAMLAAAGILVPRMLASRVGATAQYAGAGRRAGAAAEAGLGGGEQDAGDAVGGGHVVGQDDVDPAAVAHHPGAARGAGDAALGVGGAGRPRPPAGPAGEGVGQAAGVVGVVSLPAVGQAEGASRSAPRRRRRRSSPPPRLLASLLASSP